MNKKYWGVPAIALGVVTCMWTAVLAPQVLALALLALGYLMLRRYFAASTIVVGAVLGLLITIVLVLASPARRERLLEYFGVTNTVRQDAEVEYVNGDR